jgi:enoyl-CoA hydratase
MEFIQVSKIDQMIARLEVRRPEVRNALHWEAMAEFSEAIKSLGEDPDVRVLLISGEGKAFISGADLGLVKSLRGRAEGERLSREMGDALALMRSLPTITIAVIDGPARGGGAEIAVSCDLRIMSENATIGFVQTSLGLIPGWGGANRLFSLVGYSRCLEYLSTARVITAEEALRVGLVNDVFPNQDLEERVLTLAKKICANDWEAVKTTKTMLMHWETDTEDQRRSFERENFVNLWDGEARRSIFKNLSIVSRSKSTGKRKPQKFGGRGE